MVGELFSVLHEIARSDSPIKAVPICPIIRGDRIPTIAPYLINGPNIKKQQAQQVQQQKEQPQMPLLQDLLQGRRQATPRE